MTTVVVDCHIPLLLSINLVLNFEKQEVMIDGKQINVQSSNRIPATIYSQAPSD